MAIYRAAQWILVNDAPLNRISTFSDSQAAIRSQSHVVNNTRIVWKYRHYLELLSGQFARKFLQDVNLSWVNNPPLGSLFLVTVYYPLSLPMLISCNVYI